MSKSKNNLSFKLMLPLIILTILGLTQSYQFAMMGLTTFILAYLSKGMRRKSRGSAGFDVKGSQLGNKQ